MHPRRLGLAALLLLGCNRGTTPAAPADATTTTAARREAPTAVTTTAPETLVLTLRGATLRRALPLVFPGASASPQILEQLSRQFSPGIADHGDEVDADSPFAVVVTFDENRLPSQIAPTTEQPPSPFTTFVAWPLRPGMQVAQDARAQRGWRTVTEGIFAPTAPDAGANAAEQCWVAQRQPVGWMLLCGPREALPQVAGYLRQQANTLADNAPVLDLEVRSAQLARLLRRQLAELDSHAPPRADAGAAAMQRAVFEEARRTIATMSSLANDIDTVRATLTQDENAMHLRAELLASRLSSDLTRSLVAASAGRQAPPALVQSLPAAVQAWVVSGFDRAAAGSLFGTPQLNPQIAAQAGPELARVMSTVEELKGLTPLGERIDGYSPEDGYTVYHVIRRPDAAQFVNDLRVAVNSIPNRAVPGGGTLRDLATAMPTPGLTGTNVLRIGRNVRIPPGLQLTPEQRAAINAVVERSMLLVAESDRLVVILGRDPIARYRAMGQGPRLNATIPANAVMAGRITPPAVEPFFYGARIPELPPTTTAEGIDFALSVERRGEGVRAELRADAPIAAAMEVRNRFDMIQQYQLQVMQQMLRAQQAAQQGGATPRPPGGAPRPRPQPELELPEPPRLQLQPPQ